MINFKQYLIIRNANVRWQSYDENSDRIDFILSNSLLDIKTSMETITGGAQEYKVW